MLNVGSADDRVIRVSAVVLRDDAGLILTVRKRGTTRFMLPGGKPEPGESALDTAVRECAEEVGIALDPHAMRELGTFRASAANEAGFDVEAAVFEYPSPVRSPHAAAEIEELRWLDATAQPLPSDLAPLASAVLPALGHQRDAEPGRAGLVAG